MIIRAAENRDIARIVEMAERMAKESNFSSLSFSPERVASMCKTLISNGFAVVAEHDGEIIGGMLGDIHIPWFSGDSMGTDLGLYIEPQHRNGLLAAKLIKRFEDWCIGFGAKQIRPGISTGSPSAERLYKALGYQATGVQFLKMVGGV